MRLKLKLLFFIYSITFIVLTNTAYNPFLSNCNPEMVVIVPTYNNKQHYYKNIESIIEQKVEIPFKVIIVDDCSCDGTGELLDIYIKEKKRENSITVVHNDKRIGSLANLYKTITSLPDHTIVVLVDGDDHLAHENALQRVWQEYKNKNVWFAYSQMIYFSSNETGCKEIEKEVMQKNSFRDEPWVTRHLKTFYAGLFKRIELQDLLHKGKFYTMSGDFAYTFPLLEMASDNHISFIPDILYIYNDVNTISDHYINVYKQSKLGQFIRTKKSYNPLYKDKKEKADLVIFSFDRPLQLYALLESVKKYIVGLGEIHVIYRTSTLHYQSAYNEIIDTFNTVHFHKQSDNDIQDFGPLMLQATFKSPNNYILFAVDDIIVKDFISIADDISLLKKHKAYGFYYRLGCHLSYCHPTNSPQKTPTLLEKIEPNVLSWHFIQAEGDWAYPNNIDMTLYSKTDIKEDLYSLPVITPSYELHWSGISDKVKKEKGLCYDCSKIVNVPLNRVQDVCLNPHMGIDKEILLDQFNKGLKIDINPLYRIKNNAAHTEYHLDYIERN